MCEDRRLRRVAGDELQLAAMNAAEHGAEAVEVHGLLQAVADRLVDERVIRDLAVAGNVLEARGRVRKHRGHEIVGKHALQLRRELASAARARHGKRDGRIPPPPRLKHRRVEERLYQHVTRCLRVQIPEHIGQRE